MRHYVVYHNEEKMNYSIVGNYQIRRKFGEYGFVTNKDISALNHGAHTIWMIEGRAKRHGAKRQPKDYYLCERFEVTPKSVVEVEEGDWRYEASGKKGESYGNKILLNDGRDWFPKFLERMANFSIGFTELTEAEPYLNHLRTAVLPFEKKGRPSGLAAPIKPSRELSEPELSVVTAHERGFTDPDTIRKVDQAAMNYVEKFYVDSNWDVFNRADVDSLGYDFLCKKRNAEIHVEVKGRSGAKETFFLKLSQKDRAETDPFFRLAIVINALTTRPGLKVRTGPEMFRDFDLTPSEYRASPKSKKSARQGGSR